LVIWTSAAQAMGKRRVEIKLVVWLMSTTNQESTSSQCQILECDMALESSQGSYNFGLDLVAIRLYSPELWAPKVSGLQPGTTSGLQLGSPEKKSHLDVTSAERCRVHYMGEGEASPKSGPWWVLCVKVPVACPNT
jgi:hypothetical protein